jgi:hypothetical protein
MKALYVIVCSVPMLAQMPPLPPPPGLKVEVMEHSFAVGGPVVKNAPYAAEAVTETVQVLADGTRITRKNSAQLHRDSDGRTRREEKLAGTTSLPVIPARDVILIHDPVAKVIYHLNSADKTARKLPMPEFGRRALSDKIFMRSVESAPLPPPPPPATMAGPVAVEHAVRFERFDSTAEGAGKTESLGKRSIEGLVCDGTRTVTTIAAGAIGNDRPIQVTFERWYSPELQMVVMTKRNDPRFGETTYRLTNVSRGEQPRQLFEVPGDYKIEEAKPRIMHMERKLQE